LLITKQFYLFYTTRHIAPNELNKRKHQSSPDCHRLVSQVRSEIIYPFSISFPGARLLKDLLYSDRKCAPGQFWSKINNIRIYSRIISGPLTGKSFAISRNICTNKAGPPGCNGVAVLPRVFNQLDHSEYIPNGSNSPFQTVLSYLSLSLSLSQTVAATRTTRSTRTAGRLRWLRIRPRCSGTSPVPAQGR
jgi:hypothetical protein